MEFLAKIGLDKLRKNVIRRNVTLETLMKCLEELKAQKAEVSFDEDSCTGHVGMSSFLKARYEFIIKNIEEMIQVMEKGDWCFSVERTREREKEMKNMKKWRLNMRKKSDAMILSGFVSLQRPKYIECAIAVHELIPWLKEKIERSEIKTIVVLKEEFANEVGLDAEEVDNISFYQDLKFVLLVNGIVLKNGTDSGKKTFIMRMATYKDRVPKYWRKRSKLFKQLVKSEEWGIMLRNEKNKKNKSEK